MHTFPADEGRISEVERGRRCEAVVPLPPGDPLVVGDAVLFAHCVARPGQPPSFVKGGDSVLVSLTEVTDLGTTDPGTGQALIRLGWLPLGRATPTADLERGRKSRRSHRTT
jgi:hypothetical protein